MTKQLVINLPDDVYNSLEEKAQQNGLTVEKYVQWWIKLAVVENARDPIDDIIALIQSDIEDWGDHHDEHLGRSMINTLTTRQFWIPLAG